MKKTIGCFLLLCVNMPLYAAAPGYEVFYNGAWVGDVGYYIQFNTLADTCGKSESRFSAIVPMNSVIISHYVDDPGHAGVIGGQINVENVDAYICSPLNNEIIRNYTGSAGQ